jgi:hypothetical protein
MPCSRRRPATGVVDEVTLSVDSQRRWTYYRHTIIATRCLFIHSARQFHAGWSRVG